jgi:hypothetical protein
VQIDELDSVCPGTSSNSCVQKGLPEVDDFLAGAHFVLLEHVSTEPPHLRRLNHWIHPNSQYLDYFNGATLSQVDESPDGSQGACNAAASMEPPFFGVDESRAGQDHLRRDAASTGPPSPRWMNPGHWRTNCRRRCRFNGATFTKVDESANLSKPISQGLRAIHPRMCQIMP